MADKPWGAEQVLKGLLHYNENIWNVVFTEHEQLLIANSVDYAAGAPAGLPGHDLIIIIDKFQRLAAYLSSCLTEEEMADLKTRLQQANFLGAEK